LITWTIGSGGLLGGAIRAQSSQYGRTFDAGPVPWSDPMAAVRFLDDAIAAFARAAGDSPWPVAWAAGAATVSTPMDKVDQELATFTSFVRMLASRSPTGSGRFLLASSAGGVYAGSTNPPFDSLTTPLPLAPYGHLKLAQEAASVEALAGRCPVVLARIANLYGPGQNLAKPQGLVSRLAWCAARQEHVTIFVPLDTVRDYIYRDDAALACLRAVHQATQPVHLEVIASGQPVTIGRVVQVVRQVSKRRIPIALGTHPSAVAQAPDLRLCPSIDLQTTTPMPAGVKNVYEDILLRLRTDRT